MEKEDEILSKYEADVLKNINTDNMKKIICFLEKEKCDFIEDIIENYLDIFILEYDFFVKKYDQLDKRYNNKFLELASNDMNLLEDFYLI